MPHSLSLRPRDYALLLLLSWSVGIVGAIGRPLGGHDEPRVAGIARGMALSGDYVTPRLNQNPFLEYPQLGYVPTAVALRIVGAPSEFAARLPIVLLAGAVVCLIAWAGAAFGGRRLGLATGVLLATGIGFVNQNWKLVVDPVMLFFVTWSCAGYAVAFCRDSRAAAAGFWLGMAGGFLSKGLIGIGIPAVAAGGFSSLLLLGRWTGRYDGPVAPRVGWFSGPLLMMAPIAAWFAAVEHSGAGLAFEVLRQSVSRFGSESADHAGAWDLYFDKMPARTFPLVVLVIADAWTSRRARRPSTPLGVAYLFGLVWMGLTFAALSTASAKRVLYLGPLLPPAALLAAIHWERLRARFEIGPRWEWAWIVTACLSASVYAYRDTHQIAREPLTREVFAFVASQRGDRPLGLFIPTERLSGAAVFYTGEFMPSIVEKASVPGVLGDAPSALLIGEVRAALPLPDLSSPGILATPLRKFPFGDSDIAVWSLDRQP